MRFDELQLLIAIDEAQTANQAKSRFLAAMSHEMRTPLNSVIGFIDLLKFENLTGNGDLEYMGVGIATEIALEITRYQEIRVLQQTTGGKQRRASDIGARFVKYARANEANRREAVRRGLELGLLNPPAVG